MSITYSSWLSNAASVTAISSTTLESGDANFPQGIAPAAIDYAEGRMYRELDLPAVRVTDTSVIMSSGIRTIALSTTQGTLLVLDSVNMLTSAGTTSSNGTRVPLTPATKAVIDAIYPSPLSSNTGPPEFYARVTDTQLMLGPTPDQAYHTEVIATIRPSPLSAGNSSTWLTQNLPEAFEAATFVFLFGYMRDFGGQSDNPQTAQSWENQYQTLMRSAGVDTSRMKGQSAAWSAQQPSPNATPPRV